ncbi:tetratricopeptide repeat protein 9C-like [Protopterus annectens]|uniref:tetratricopeptide repeat protein 9C-like n=1 Tax=Protopterus annectens TaxID=7888 RepID=UPI001CFB43BB|nr:tetratricopeptide repeat protein 9C-like [Protopterus annectens]
MAEKVSSEETVECRIQKALAFKAEGNRCYKDKCFREAIGKYHRALLQVKDLDADALALVQPYGGKMFKLSQEQTDLVHSIQTDCYNNLSGDLEGWSLSPSQLDESVSPDSDDDGSSSSHLYYVIQQWNVRTRNNRPQNIETP